MIATAATVIAAFLTAAAAAAAFLAWFYKRGRHEESLANSIDRNSEATDNLAAQVGGLRTTLEAHASTLTEHHYRIKALEDAR